MPSDASIPPRQPRNVAEAAFYNQGVLDVISRAEEAASAIAATSKRRVHEDFAVAALTGLAEHCRALLRDQAEPPSTDATPGASHGR